MKNKVFWVYLRFLSNKHKAFKLWLYPELLDNGAFLFRNYYIGQRQVSGSPKIGMIKYEDQARPMPTV
jgi:hypothetical protein